MATKNCNSMIIELLETKPIAFNPLLAKVSKSACAGLFMSQLLYWYGKGIKKDWVYKTIEEMTEETQLTRREQDTSIKKWKVLGVLNIKLMGIPAKRHFKIDIDKLIDLLGVVVKNAKLDCQKRQTSTESTTEI